MPSKALVLSAAAAVACAACASSANNPPGAFMPADGGEASDGSDAPVSPPDVGDAPGPGDGGDAAASSDAAPLMLSASVVATIALPGVPISAAYVAATRKAYFACQTPSKDSAGVAVVDDVMNTVAATITPAAAVTSLAASATTKTIYAAEGATIEVIDSTTDTVTKTVKIPDGSLIAGMAVDEAHGRLYIVTTAGGMTELFVFDGAALTSLRQPLLTPAGTPPVAVDSPTQQLFVLGVDSNLEGEIVTLDGPSGAPTHLATTTSKVEPEVSGIVPLGDGTAAILLVKPGIVKRLDHKDVALPKAFTPAGIAAADLGRGAPTTLVVGFDADGGVLEGYGVDTASGALSPPFAVPLVDALPDRTLAARLLAAAPLNGGSEVYVDPTPDPKSTAPFSPTVTIKITVTAAPP
jgi:hypothetical protein